MMRVINVTKNKVICEKCGLADKLLSRIIGLIGRKSLGKDEGLLITGCRSIHMMFMSFPICAIFIDKQNRVIKIIDIIKPWRISGYYYKADRVIELPPWRAKETGTKAGDVIVLE